MESVFYGFENENIMTKEQHQEFIEFALELKWNRDAYSRARIIEELMGKVDELVKNCSIPAVVGRSEQFYCPCCGSDKTYKTEAYHCNRCAVTTEV